MDGWNVDRGTGEITEAPEAGTDLAALVSELIGDEGALKTLREALLGEEQKDPLPLFGSVEEWVEKVLTLTFRAQLTHPNLRWCEQWWRHTEARMVLDSMWRSWEKARREDALAGWLVHVHYPLFDRLTGDKSPFIGCTHSDGEEDGSHAPMQKRLPIGVPPEDLFPKVPTKAHPKR